MCRSHLLPLRYNPWIKLLLIKTVIGIRYEVLSVSKLPDIDQQLYACTIHHSEGGQHHSEGSQYHSGGTS